jgi:hypothetical protein
MHAGHKGRDVLGQMIAGLHARGIDVVIYCVMIFADWYWDNHPEGRVVDSIVHNRYGKGFRISRSTV